MDSYYTTLCQGEHIEELFSRVTIVAFEGIVTKELEAMQVSEPKVQVAASSSLISEWSMRGLWPHPHICDHTHVLMQYDWLGCVTCLAWGYALYWNGDMLWTALLCSGMEACFD